VAAVGTTWASASSGAAVSYSTPSPRCALAQTHKHRHHHHVAIDGAGCCHLQGRKPPADGGTTVMFCDLVESTGIAAKLNVRRSHPLMQS
jgi:hypothetical protein